MDFDINTQRNNPLEYKCPNCSAALSFDPGQQRVACPNCGTVFENEALEAIAQDAQGGGFDWGDYKSSFARTERMDTKVYQCQSCSALIEADENTAATKCPYCDSNVVLHKEILQLRLSFSQDKSKCLYLLQLRVSYTYLKNAQHHETLCINKKTFYHSIPKRTDIPEKSISSPATVIPFT